MPRPPSTIPLHGIKDEDGKKYQYYVEERLPVMVLTHDNGSQEIVLLKDFSIIARHDRATMNVYLAGIAFGLHAAKEFAT